MQADLELKRASRRPADGTGGLIGEESMGNEPQRQTDDADAKGERVEQQDVDDPAESAAPC
jgi:hypothetical protein